jgi:metallo-beta-lactamase class B
MKAFLLCLLSGLASAALSYAQVPADHAWRKPFPAVRIAGNVYYVGTHDLASYLITSPAGHILINTGLDDSAAQIRANIESAGFQYADIKLLLIQQAHYDHTAALAQIKRETGARMLATAKDKPALEAGEPRSAAVAVDGVIKDGQVIELGGVKLRVVSTPGHTEGSVSYALTVKDGGRDYRILIANMPAVVRPLLKAPGYAGSVDDFRLTFRTLRAAQYDILLAAHASQFGLHDKYAPGAAHNPEKFVNREELKARVDEYEKLFHEKLAAEQSR